LCCHGRFYAKLARPAIAPYLPPVSIHEFTALLLPCNVDGKEQ